MATFNRQFKSRLSAYFVKRLGMVEYKRGWLKGDCPSCGREFKFGVNMGLNRSNCFVCGYNKSPIDIVLELESFSVYTEAIDFINKTEEFEEYVYKEEQLELKERKDTFLPEGFRLLNQGNSTIAKIARNYVKKRGFNPTLKSREGWGYGTRDKYLGYLIIPFTSEGKLVYFNARKFMGNGPRYNNPSTDVTGIGKSMIWYNRDALFMYKSVFICEGAINASTVGPKAIASGGKFVSRYQINDLIKSPVERFIILLDPDAKCKALDLALTLVDFKMVKVVYLPDGKDCNDLGLRKTMRLVYNTRYQDRQTLMKMKLEL